MFKFPTVRFSSPDESTCKKLDENENEEEIIPGNFIPGLNELLTFRKENSEKPISNSLDNLYHLSNTETNENHFSLNSKMVGEISFTKSPDGTPRTIAKHRATMVNSVEIEQKIKEKIKTSPGALGAILRSVREEFKIDLQDIQRSTKIPLSYLNAIEADSYFKLPAVVYYHGFITSYLKYFGIEKPELAKEFTNYYKDKLKELKK